MPRDQPVRASLRAATADAHDRVDRAFSTFELTSRAGYGAFLQAQARAFWPLEDALEAGGVSALVSDWPERRRSAALREDLEALGLAAPEVSRSAPITEPGAALGTLYVLEGSRLGGALLKRAVPGGFPTAFLSPAPAGSWRTFLEVLESSLTTDDLRTAALSAARGAFALFERSAAARAESLA